MQELIVILIVVSAGLYLSWKFYQKFYKKEEGCEKCAIGDLNNDSK